MRWRSDFDYQDGRTPSAETIPSQTSKFGHVEIINVSHKPTYDRSLERYCAGDQILIIKMVEHPQLKPYRPKLQTFGHVEIINVSHKPT